MNMRDRIVGDELHEGLDFMRPWCGVLRAFMLPNTTASKKSWPRWGSSWLLVAVTGWAARQPSNDAARDSQPYGNERVTEVTLGSLGAANSLDAPLGPRGEKTEHARPQ
jgi:hypothetical protein